MRLASALLVVAACGGGSGPPAKPAAKHYRLDDLPFKEWIGLPMSGDAVVGLDVKGQDDLRTAKGRITVACPSGCRIGDDKTKLVPKAPSRMSAFAGDGIDVGHIDLGNVDIAIAIRDGKATIEHWELTSPDLVLRVTGGATFGKQISDMQLDLCVRFGATPALQQRDAKTAALLQTTGAATGADDSFYIAVTGTVGAPRMMARVCDGSAPAAVPAPPAATAPQLVPAATLDAADVDLTGIVTKTSETAFDIDATKLATVLQNPMSVARDARLVPAVKDGKPSGLKLYAIKAGTLFAQAGLENGDVLVSVRGHGLAAADQALEVYTMLTNLKVGDRFDVELERAGARRTHVYTLR